MRPKIPLIFIFDNSAFGGYWESALLDYHGIKISFHTKLKYSAVIFDVSVEILEKISGLKCGKMQKKNSCRNKLKTFFRRAMISKPSV